MNLHYTHQSSIQIVTLGLFGIKNLDGKCSSRDSEDLTIKEVAGELLSFKGCGCDNQCEILPSLYHFLENSEQYIGVDGSLVGLVQHYATVLGQVPIYESLSQQHTVCHILNDCFAGGEVLKTNGVAHFFTKFDAHLLTYSLRHTHCGDSSRLGTAYLSYSAVSCFEQVLSDLGSFTRPSLADNYQDFVGFNSIDELVFVCEDREVCFLLSARYN